MAITAAHTPADLQKAAAEKSAATYGLQLVGIDQYKQDDADLSVQIGKMNAAGAGAGAASSSARSSYR